MSDKSNVPRFFVASKIKNMVKSIPNINLTNNLRPAAAATTNAKEKDSDTIHSFHISESQQKPFLDCDALFTDCEEFLKLSYRAIEASNSKGKSGLSKLVHAVPISDKISKWRSKKKESDLYENYEAIQARVEQMDTTLNDISHVAATSTSALITQSVHLNVRLTSCIDYNRSEVDKAKPLVAEGRAFLNKLKSNEKALMAMIDFLEEVNELKRTEPKAYVPWALRQQVEDDAEAERKAAMARNEVVELKRSSIEKRLKRIRAIIVPVQRLFDATEQRQHTRLNNLSHCLRSQLALLNFLHRCQTATGGAVGGGAVQALANKSSSNPTLPIPPSASGTVPPPPTSSPTAAPKSSGFMNFSNPIKFGGGSSKSPVPAAKGAAPSAAPYKPTLAELAAGIIPNGAGQMRPSMERNSESSTASSDRASLQASSKAKATAAPEVASFDNDNDDSSSDDADDDEVDADDPSNPDNNIEKAVRHMRVALTSLQRNSGLILEKVEPYDHCNCSDCAVVYDMANDCCMHIAAANFRSKQCAERLLRLSSYKDRMRENADLLDSQDPHQG